jgi:hypothetical protein
VLVLVLLRQLECERFQRLMLRRMPRLRSGAYVPLIYLPILGGLRGLQNDVSFRDPLMTMMP